MSAEAEEIRLLELYGHRAKIDSQIEVLEKRAARRAAELVAAKATSERAARLAHKAHEARVARVDALSVDLDLIRMRAAESCGIVSTELFIDSRETRYVEARMVAYKCARSLGMTLQRIGFWAGRDHSSVVNALKKIETRPDLLAKSDRVLESMGVTVNV